MIVQWKNGITILVTLKDMKEAYPVQADEYEVENRVSSEPALAWWDTYVLKKRNQITEKEKSKYWVRSNNYGIKVPNNVDQAKQSDEKNCNKLWCDSIGTEMKNV